jgi:DNA-binding protein
MTLLQELIQLDEGKRQTKLPAKGKKIPKVAVDNTAVPRDRNFVAKNSQAKTGAGAHEAKRGEKASRNRQNKNWKKDAKGEM